MHSVTSQLKAAKNSVIQSILKQAHTKPIHAHQPQNKLYKCDLFEHVNIIFTLNSLGLAPLHIITSVAVFYDAEFKNRGRGGVSRTGFKGLNLSCRRFAAK